MQRRRHGRHRRRRGSARREHDHGRAGRNLLVRPIHPDNQAQIHNTYSWVTPRRLCCIEGREGDKRTALIGEVRETFAYSLA